MNFWTQNWVLSQCVASATEEEARWRAKTFVITIEFLKGEFSKLERMGTHVRGKSMIVILQNDEELSIMQHTDQLSHNYLRLLSNLKLSLKATSVSIFHFGFKKCLKWDFFTDFQTLCGLRKTIWKVSFQCTF